MARADLPLGLQRQAHTAHQSFNGNRLLFFIEPDGRGGIGLDEARQPMQGGPDEEGIMLVWIGDVANMFGSDAVEDRSLAGPTRCRSIAWCPTCRNPVEVMR